MHHQVHNLVTGFDSKVPDLTDSWNIKDFELLGGLDEIGKWFEILDSK